LNHPRKERHAEHSAERGPMALPDAAPEYDHHVGAGRKLHDKHGHTKGDNSA
jgi:hypothetical protein